MNLTTDKNKIIDCVYKLCKECHIPVHHRESLSSNSLYFYVQGCVIMNAFRISDHVNQNPQFRKMKSFCVSDGTKIKHIEAFVKNRIKFLKEKSLRYLLNNISQLQYQNTQAIAY